ncbi:MAG: NUDIX domain-containing protein [Chloroflexi bacterium]|nr:NUDIX domain-containing protein [Chloroflexota bacterium]
MMSVEKKYPNLFNEVTWPWGPTRAKFLLLDKIPPSHLIGNINIVPKVGNSWLMLRHQNGSWDIPGGTIEKDEYYMDTLRRELIEEAGAKLHSFKLFGAWHCVSLAPKPYRSHLPHPEYYRIVGLGDVEVIQSPTNPLMAR